MKHYPHLDVDEVMTTRFSTGSPRSDAYRRGFRARLVQLRNASLIHRPWPYAAGTAESDAWFAGLSDAEHHVEWLIDRGDLPHVA